MARRGFCFWATSFERLELDVEIEMASRSEADALADTSTVIPLVKPLGGHMQEQVLVRSNQNGTARIRTSTKNRSVGLVEKHERHFEPRDGGSGFTICQANLEESGWRRKTKIEFSFGMFRRKRYFLGGFHRARGEDGISGVDIVGAYREFAPPGYPFESVASAGIRLRFRKARCKGNTYWPTRQIYSLRGFPSGPITIP
jgi:hypothetical protein